MWCNYNNWGRVGPISLQCLINVFYTEHYMKATLDESKIPVFLDLTLYQYEWRLDGHYSWNVLFQKALSLSHRPVLHNTTIIIPVVLGLYIIGLFSSHQILKRLPWITALSWLSHHIRDASRRGLWFAPLGSTPPLPQWMYITLTLILPLFFKAFITYFQILKNGNKPNVEVPHLVWVAVYTNLHSTIIKNSEVSHIYC